MSTLLGQSVFIENKAGAAGTIGLTTLSAGAPDGYTIMQLNNTTTVALQFASKPLDLDKRVTVIGAFSIAPLILAVNPKVVDVRNLNELIEQVRRRPGLDYTSSGPGSPSNIGMQVFSKRNNLRMTHVPYKGIGPAMLDVLAGRIGVILTDGGAAKPHIKSGAIRAIAIVSSVRSPLAPDVPTATEQGHPPW